MGCFRIASVLLLGGLGSAQSQPSPEINPDIRLELRTRGNQQTFRIGEIIPLELRFSSIVENKYRLDTRSGDLTGRVDMERYAVEPHSGWCDPLDPYFRIAEIIEGGSESIRVLTADSFLVATDLNEWVRFDQPGQYRVTVTSWRVFASSRHSPLAIVSDPVLLTIVAPTPEWQQTTLSDVITTLAQSLVSRLVGLPNNPQDRREAIRVLRFLGTAGAARELAQLIDDTYCGNEDCLLGLAGSPVRKVAFDELSKVLPHSRHAHEIRWAHLMSFLATPEDEGYR
jgi:hypothetical protein